MPFPFALFQAEVTVSELVVKLIRDGETCIEILKKSVSDAYLRMLKYTYENRFRPVESQIIDFRIFHATVHCAIGFLFGIVVGCVIGGIAVIESTRNQESVALSGDNIFIKKAGENEIAITKMMKHENIVKLVGIFQWADGSYMALARTNGSLFDYVAAQQHQR